MSSIPMPLTSSVPVDPNAGIPSITVANTRIILDWLSLENIFIEHLAWSVLNNRISGTPAWDPEGLNIIGIRMNDVDFYRRDSRAFNDYLILALPNRIELFECTVDPAIVNENPNGIAHLMEGCWDSYARGAHKGRPAIIQSIRPVRVQRTNDAGDVLMEDKGMFGINIHNASGLSKPSAGCTVLKPDRGWYMQDRNYRRFLEMRAAAPDRPSRTYCLINVKQLWSYLGQDPRLL